MTIKKQSTLSGQRAERKLDTCTVVRNGVDINYTWIICGVVASVGKHLTCQNTTKRDTQFMREYKKQTLWEYKLQGL